MNHTDQINLGDPVIRHALYETGKWSRIIAIISGVLLGLAAIGIAVVLIAMPTVMNEAFLENPMLATMSPIYLGVMYVVTVVVGIYVSIKLFQFGKILKGNGPRQHLSNVETNQAFQNLLNILKIYAIFSVLSLVANVVMMLL